MTFVGRRLTCLSGIGWVSSLAYRPGRIVVRWGVIGFVRTEDTLKKRPEVASLEQKAEVEETGHQI